MYQFSFHRSRDLQLMTRSPLQLLCTHSFSFPMEFLPLLSFPYFFNTKERRLWLKYVELELGELNMETWRNETAVPRKSCVT